MGERYNSKGYPQRNAAHFRGALHVSQAVHNLVQEFSEGRTSIEDERRVGRPMKEQSAHGCDSNHKNFTPHVCRDL